MWWVLSWSKDSFVNVGHNEAKREKTRRILIWWQKQERKVSAMNSRTEILLHQLTFSFFYAVSIIDMICDVNQLENSSMFK